MTLLCSERPWPALLFTTLCSMAEPPAPMSLSGETIADTVMKRLQRSSDGEMINHAISPPMVPPAPAHPI
jgi:hypothetical protein